MRRSVSTLIGVCLSLSLCSSSWPQANVQTPSPDQEQLTKPEPVQEQVTVYATRTEGRLEDQPTRIELLDQEEIDEKTMRRLATSS